MKHPTFRFLEITSDGIVRRSDNRMLLTPCLSYNGYHNIQFRHLGKRITKSVHRLVLETFSPIAQNSNLQCNHKNGDKLDNRIENLEWCTQSENTKHRFKVLGHIPGRTSLTPEQRSDILFLFKVMAGTCRAKFKFISERFGVSSHTVKAICFRQSVYADNRLFNSTHPVGITHL